jgi:predicted DNA-binding transcriptional regulator YafY
MHQLRAQHARGRLLFDTKPWFRSQATSPYLDTLRASIWKDECIQINYRRSNDEEKEYLVEPYALVVKVDTWYLIGRVKKETRVFRISRMLSLQTTGTHFTRDADFDLQKFWSNWCEKFEQNPPTSFPVELMISAKGRQQLLDSFGSWFRRRLEPLGDQFKGRKPVTLDFEREERALRIMFDLVFEADIVSPITLRRKLRSQAKRVVAATE